MDFLKTPEMRLFEDAKKQYVIDELTSGHRDEVAWAKALKSAKGNPAYAEALYIEERIKRLADFEHVISGKQAEQRLKYLEGEIRDIDKIGTTHSRVLSLLVVACFPFAVVLFWEGDVELGAAVVLVIICSGIFSAVKLARLDKQREKLKSELDTLAPKSERGSWIGPLFVLAVAALTLGYLFA